MRLKGVWKRREKTAYLCLKKGYFHLKSVWKGRILVSENSLKRRILASKKYLEKERDNSIFVSKKGDGKKHIRV